MEQLTHEEMIENFKKYVQRLVAGGFDPHEQILAEAIDVAADDFPDRPAEAWVRPIVDAAFAEHFRQQATWSAVTDCDRLDAAFAELDAGGIVSRQHFSCCGTCAAAEIRSVIDELLAQGKTVRGYTSYDVQSTESAAEGYGIALNYGSVENDKPTALVIAREVVDSLKRHSLSPCWDGKWESRIMVDLDWKRRRIAWHQG